MTPPNRGAARESYVDLHMHSTASDGALTPPALIAAAHDAGLAAVALTDHDTTAGLDEAAAAALALGVRVVAGVELSAVEGDEEVHLLGLHLGRVAEIERELHTFRVARRVRAEAILERLRALGVDVPWKRVAELAGNGAIGRPHIARAMVEQGSARDHRDAFDRYLSNGGPAYVPKYRLPLGEAVDLVHRAGGLAIVAHPGATGTRLRVEGWVGLGVDGLEVRHPGHTVEDMTRLGTLVETFHLVPSGGSDWHGVGVGARALGSMTVPLEWLERQEARLVEMGAQGRVA